MNIFSNDGSFLDQFKKLSGVKGEQEHYHSRLKKNVIKIKVMYCCSQENIPISIVLP